MLDCTLAYGLSFLFPAGDSAVGASLKNHGEFSRVELDFLLDHADAADSATFIDVGANIGSIALPFAKARPSWQVFAIEAHRGLAGLLAANTHQNLLSNVEVFNAAAGPERVLADFPTISFSIPGNFGQLRFGTTGATEAVRMLTLDEVAPPDTRIIKVDVEGFEPEVLKGSSGLLEREEAIWLLEASIHRPTQTAEVIRTFQLLGYNAFWFYVPFVTPVAPKGPPIDASKGDSNIVVLPRHIGNKWNLTPVQSPDEQRPPDISSYLYLNRYGIY
ncbi:MAG: FkbM family methyltransferase [Caulobacterales bacterium]|nr:FkbM family methyltransferase [Caulobacterales bacterium]